MKDLLLLILEHNFGVIKILKPHQIYLKTDKNYWFFCKVCNHEFEKKPINLAFRENEWCPYCSCKTRSKLCDDENCIFCFNNSFASNSKSIEWSKLNNILPRFVNISSIKEYLFNCSKCNHLFSKRINNVKRGVWCPYCSNQKLCDDLNCKHCFNVSFASSQSVNLFSPKNNVDPRFIFKGTPKKYIFICNICNNDFTRVMASIKNNCYCAKCQNKTEKKLLDYLKNIYPNIIHQYKKDWCKNEKTNILLPFDYCLEEFKIIIELDGKQHFEIVDRFRSNPDENHKKDLYKQECANKNGFSIIRIWQMDVYNDKNDWKNKLIDSINKIIYEKKIQNIYLSSGNHYEIFKDYIL